MCHGRGLCKGGDCHCDEGYSGRFRGWRQAEGLGCAINSGTGLESSQWDLDDVEEYCLDMRQGREL